MMKHLNQEEEIMRKASLVLLVGIALFLVPNLVCAQAKGSSFGFGASMGKEVLPIEYGRLATVLDFPSFYMPIHISPGFRIEPEIGLWRYSYSRKDGTDWESSYSVFSLGFGIFPVINKGKVHIYYGARLRLISTSTSSAYSWNGHTESDDESKTDVSIGPAIGGEYFFTDHLSLGGEAQLNYTSIGQFDDDDDDQDVSESIISSKTLFFVRWYF